MIEIPDRSSTPMMASLRWLLMLPLAALAGCVESPFFYPDREVYGSPAQQGLKYEEVTFRSRDGTRLSGWFVPAADGSQARQARGTVVHFHGNAQNLSSHWSFVEWLPRRGYNVFVFDYRGYGKSEGKPSFKGVFEDANAALDAVRARPDIDPQRLLVFGQSLGGATAIATVGSGNRAGVRAIAIEGAFSSHAAIAGEKFTGAGRLVDDAYSPDRFVANLAPLPLLLLHGTRDAIVPPHHSDRLFAKAGEPKRLVKVEGGNHLDTLIGGRAGAYQDLLVQFFEAALPPPGPR